MARGDGKARKGLTRGSSSERPRYTSGGVQKLAFGGKPGESAMARAEASRSPASSGGLGASTRDGGFGGAASPGGAGGGGNGRIGSSQTPNVITRTERMSAITGPESMNMRLGPNAAQAMAAAGVDPDVALGAARSINRRVGDSPSILGDPNPGQRLATANRDGSFTYSPIQSSTIVKNQTKQFYDRILPEDDVVGGFGPFNPATGYVPKMQGTSIDTGWDAATGTFKAAAPSLPSARMTSAQDMASIVPGSVSFKQDKSFTPFAQTRAGMDLLQQSKSPLTVEQAKALKSQFPEGSSIALAGGQPPPGTTAYPATVGGFKVDVFVPDKAGVTTLGPKVGTFEPKAQTASPLTGYTGQEQRFRPAPVIRGQEQRFAPAPASGGAVAPPQGASTPAVKAPSNVVAGRTNFGPARGPFDPFREGRGGEGRRPRRKKPIIEEETTTNVRHGGAIRGDGKAAFGKTRGRTI